MLVYVPDEEPDGGEDDSDPGLERVLPDPVRPEPTNHEGEQAAGEKGGGASSRED